MISYAQYTAKLIIYYVFNSTNQTVFLNEVKLKNASATSKHSINGLGVKSIFLFVLHL
jgi:hypothetical protein